MSSNSVGLFIPLPPAIAATFPKQGRAGEDSSPAHVTFLYMGSVSKEQESQFLQIVTAACQNVWAPVTAHLTGGVERFQDTVAEKTAWVMPVKFSTDISKVRWQIYTDLIHAGFVVEEGFPLSYRPHSTIAYEDGLGIEKYKGSVPEPATWTFDEIEVWGLSAKKSVPLNRTLINQWRGGQPTKQYRY